MNALYYLREIASMRENKVWKQWKEKEREETNLQKIRDEVFRAIGAIYIEPFASRPPHAFQESSESS
jgi:hypothetical protein